MCNHATFTGFQASYLVKDDITKRYVQTLTSYQNHQGIAQCSLHQKRSEAHHAGTGRPEVDPAGNRTGQDRHQLEGFTVMVVSSLIWGS